MNSRTASCPAAMASASPASPADAASGTAGTDGPGRESGGTRHTVSPRTRSGSRLVATSRSCGQPAIRSRTRSATASTTCSQVSRISSSCRPRSASTRVAEAGRSGSSPMPRTLATCRAVRAGSAVSASSTSQIPSGKSSLRCQPSRVASLVLPMPPGPHSVRARTLLSSSVRSPRSRSRPTKLFGSAGRLPRRGTVSAVIATSVCLRVIRSSLSPGCRASGPSENGGYQRMIYRTVTWAGSV